MILKESLIYLEENLSRLKEELICQGVKLTYIEKRSLEIDIDKTNNLITYWREMLKR